MSSTNRLFLLLAATFVLAGCGPKETDDNQAKEADDRRSIYAAYSPLVGIYRGTVVPDAGARRAIPVEIQVKIVEVADGVDSNRRARFRPDLQGTFTRLDYLSITPVARRPLKMAYTTESQQIAMQNSDQITSPTPNQGNTNIFATIRDGVIDGTISFTIGDEVIGHINVVR